MRLSESSLKKDAKSFKRNNPDYSLGEALDTIARRHGYQSWKHIKPLLEKLKTEFDLKNILYSDDHLELRQSYREYMNDKQEEAAFHILCRLSKVVNDLIKKEDVVARFHSLHSGARPDVGRMINLSAATMYIATNLGWHQAHGIGCKEDKEGAKNNFLYAAEQASVCALPYGQFSLGRFYELIEDYPTACEQYEIIIEDGHMGTGGTYYQLAKIYLEGRVQNAEIARGEHCLTKALKKKHPLSGQTLDNYNRLVQRLNSSRIQLTLSGVHEMVRDSQIFQDYADYSRPDPDILMELEL